MKNLYIIKLSILEIETKERTIKTCYVFAKTLKEVDIKINNHFDDDDFKDKEILDIKILHEGYDNNGYLIQQYNENR